MTDNQASRETLDFVGKVAELNRQLADVFNSGNVEIFTQMNGTIKEIYALQHGSEDYILQSVDEDCAVIYGNFDMIIAVLRTTENGEIDRGAQKAIDKLLRNIHKATVNIAGAFGLI